MANLPVSIRNTKLKIDLSCFGFNQDGNSHAAPAVLLEQNGIQECGLETEPTDANANEDVFDVDDNNSSGSEDLDVSDELDNSDASDEETATPSEPVVNTELDEDHAAPKDSHPKKLEKSSYFADVVQPVQSVNHRPFPRATKENPAMPVNQQSEEIDQPEVEKRGLIRKKARIESKEDASSANANEMSLNVRDTLAFLTGKRLKRPCGISCEYCSSGQACGSSKDQTGHPEEPAEIPSMSVLRSEKAPEVAGISFPAGKKVCIKSPMREEVEDSEEKSARKTSYNVSIYRSAANVQPVALPKPGGTPKNPDRKSFPYWSVMYSKPNTRTRKTWEDQGLLVVEGTTLTLQTTDGEFVGKTCHAKVNMLKPDEVIKVGPKEVQLLEGLDRKEYLDTLAGRF